MRDADPAPALRVAHEAAAAWLASLPERRVGPARTSAELLAALDGPVPEVGTAADETVRRLVAAVEPGLMAVASGRFLGWVMGGALPAAIAADWLVSAWDQNAGMAALTPGAAAIEQVAARWVLELLDLPAGASVGFVTGGQAANTVCLAAARGRVLAAAGWDVEADGLIGAPPVTVVVGGERHDTIDRALRLLGFGRRAIAVADADAAGRMRPAELDARLREHPGPVVVCLQAGNVNGGAVDPVGELLDVVAAHDRGGQAWVHVDGAFGLWARVSRHHAALLAGVERADSWATDAHKWLNTPYDCGLAICADAHAHRRAMGVTAAYLPPVEGPAVRDPVDFNPELSRRARAVPVWAALCHLGREGLRDLVEQTCAMADRFAVRLAAVPGVEVLHHDLNQVVVRFLARDGDHDAHTRAVLARVQQEGTCYPSGTVWRGGAAVRLSVTSWRTDADDVDRSVAALAAAHAGG